MRTRALAFLLLWLLSPHALALRSLPDNSLYLPVLAEIAKSTPEGGYGYGSGFFLKADSDLYFVTAKHVLFTPRGEMLGNEITLFSYPKDSYTVQPRLMKIDLQVLSAKGHVKSHPTRDIALIRIGKLIEDGTKADYLPEVVHLGNTSLPLATADLGIVRKYNEVLVGDEVITFGYPVSLGLGSQQLDPSRPLLRKGIIAGLNPLQQTIILDSPSFGGNSGGPVLEREWEGVGYRFFLIGVVTAFVPYAIRDSNGHETGAKSFNSGYSIAVPMDYVLELVADKP